MQFLNLPEQADIAVQKMQNGEFNSIEKSLLTETPNDSAYSRKSAVASPELHVCKRWKIR